MSGSVIQSGIIIVSRRSRVCYLEIGCGYRRTVRYGHGLGRNDKRAFLYSYLCRHGKLEIRLRVVGAHVAAVRNSYGRLTRSRYLDVAVGSRSGDTHVYDRRIVARNGILECAFGSRVGSESRSYSEVVVTVNVTVSGAEIDGIHAVGVFSEQPVFGVARGIIIILVVAALVVRFGIDSYHAVVTAVGENSRGLGEGNAFYLHYFHRIAAHHKAQRHTFRIHEFESDLRGRVERIYRGGIGGKPYRLSRAVEFVLRVYLLRGIGCDALGRKHGIVIRVGAGVFERHLLRNGKYGKRARKRAGIVAYAREYNASAAPYVDVFAVADAEIDALLKLCRKPRIGHGRDSGSDPRAGEIISLPRRVVSERF